jgi:hypothetical protein
MVLGPVPSSRGRTGHVIRRVLDVRDVVPGLTAVDREPTFDLLGGQVRCLGIARG